MRLFVFGIGGTGGRLLEALTYLLASGIELVDSSKGAIEVVPILLDTDAANKDTRDGVSALELYASMHAHRTLSDKVGFFATNIRKLSSLAKDGSNSISPTFRLNFKGIENSTLRDFIGFEQIDNFQTKRLLEALYSEDNMDDKLTGGFLGNPNVGSIVLSGFKDSADFSLFATSFSPGDRIFIAGSIFGGTGAAGLPWLLKALRSEIQCTGAADAIRNSAVGALVVLPYFKLQEDSTSRIDSNEFITKTKAALSYYYHNIHGINSVYYIGDTALATYANHESGEKQSNAAHLIELLGALAIVKFAGMPDSECLPPVETYHECAIATDSPSLNFAGLGRETSALFAKQLTQLRMMALLDKSHFQGATHQPWAKDNGFSRQFFDSPDYRSLSLFLQSYYSVWIQQLAENNRAFSPFGSVTNMGDLTSLLNEQNPNRTWPDPQLSAESFDIEANKLRIVDGGAAGSLSRFFKLWWSATATVYDHAYDQYSAERHTV